MPTLSEKTAGGLALPPYGYMNALYMWDVDTRRVPDKFTVDGRAATAVEWRDFVDGFVDEVADFLWPRFDQKKQAWQGKAASLAMELTRADLDLMDRSLFALLHAPVGAGPKGNATHKAMFEEEDESKPGVLYPTLDPYLAGLPADTLLQLKEAIKKSLVGFGPAPLRFKELLQRPRPHQVAFMMGRPFSWELARSSMTPSMLSGHCLQGLVGRTSGYMAMRLQLGNFGSATRELQQFSVDIGDRRVFAGVHYPSDNLASWYCALRLCDHLFGEAGQVAKDFMREAIEKSVVFAAMMETVTADPKSPFAEPMKKLAAEAQRTAKRSEQ